MTAADQNAADKALRDAVAEVSRRLAECGWHTDKSSVSVSGDAAIHRYYDPASGADSTAYRVLMGLPRRLITIELELVRDTE